MTDTIKAKRGKQWYLWTRNGKDRWMCWRCDWTGMPTLGVGIGRTPHEAFADLEGGA